MGDLSRWDSNLSQPPIVLIICYFLNLLKIVILSLPFEFPAVVTSVKLPYVISNKVRRLWKLCQILELSVAQDILSTFDSNSIVWTYTLSSYTIASWFAWDWTSLFYGSITNFNLLSNYSLSLILINDYSLVFLKWIP